MVVLGLDVCHHHFSAHQDPKHLRRADAKHEGAECTTCLGVAVSANHEQARLQADSLGKSHMSDSQIGALELRIGEQFSRSSLEIQHAVLDHIGAPGDLQ